MSFPQPVTYLTSYWKLLNGESRAKDIGKYIDAADWLLRDMGLAYKQRKGTYSLTLNRMENELKWNGYEPPKPQALGRVVESFLVGKDLDYGKSAGSYWVRLDKVAKRKISEFRDRLSSIYPSRVGLVKIPDIFF